MAIRINREMKKYADKIVIPGIYKVIEAETIKNEDALQELISFASEASLQRQMEYKISDCFSKRKE